MITAKEIRDRALIAKRIAGDLVDIERKIKQHADSGWPSQLTVTMSLVRDGGQGIDAIVIVLREAGYYVTKRDESASHVSIIISLEATRS